MSDYRTISDAIVGFTKRTGQATVARICSEFRIGDAKARRHLRELVGSGVLIEHRNGRGRTTLRIYRLNPDWSGGTLPAKVKNRRVTNCPSADLTLRISGQQLERAMKAGVAVEGPLREAYITRKVLRLTPSGLEHLNQLIEKLERELIEIDDPLGRTFGFTIVLARGAVVEGEHKIPPVISGRSRTN